MKESHWVLRVSLALVYWQISFKLINKLRIRLVVFLFFFILVVIKYFYFVVLIVLVFYMLY